MKNKRGLLLLLCFVLCLVISYPVQAESSQMAKQLLLNRLQTTNIYLPNDLVEKLSASGNAALVLKRFSGTLFSDCEQLKDLEGSSLNFDYKFNIPEKKIEANYDLSYNNKNYTGSIFINDNKLILSTEILSLIKEIDPDFNINGQINIPKYVYSTSSEFNQLWDEIINTNPEEQYMQPELNDLLAFIIEAIPNKYFSVSLVNQKVTFSIDQQGLDEVIFSLMQKITNEKERFASIIADIAATSNPDVNQEEIKSEIIRALEDRINEGDFPSLKEIQQALASFIDLDELKYEVSLLPAGQRKLVAAINLIGETKYDGRITINTDFTGGEDNLNGTYALRLSVRDKKGKIIDVVIQMDGQDQLTGDKARSNFSIKAKAKDLSENTTLLDLNVEGSFRFRADKDVQINIPVLTESNSLNVEPFINDNSLDAYNDSPEVSVLVDGEPVIFVVAPLVKDGRIMVPVRNLAENLGGEVTWVEPDQVNICREDISITMYIDKQLYTVNSAEKHLDVPPFLKYGTITMVPLRFVAEELGCRVEYDDASNTVFIFSK